MANIIYEKLLDVPFKNRTATVVRDDAVRITKVSGPPSSVSAGAAQPWKFKIEVQDLTGRWQTLKNVPLTLRIQRSRTVSNQTTVVSQGATQNIKSDNNGIIDISIAAGTTTGWEGDNLDVILAFGEQKPKTFAQKTKLS